MNISKVEKLKFVLDRATEHDKAHFIDVMTKHKTDVNKTMYLQWEYSEKVGELVSIFDLLDVVKLLDNVK